MVGMLESAFPVQRGRQALPAGTGRDGTGRHRSLSLHPTCGVTGERVPAFPGRGAQDSRSAGRCPLERGRAFGDSNTTRCCCCDLDCPVLSAGLWTAMFMPEAGALQSGYDANARGTTTGF